MNEIITVYSCKKCGNTKISWGAILCTQCDTADPELTWEHIVASEALKPVVPIEPVKKTEKKYTLMLVHGDFEHDYSKDLDLTPTTANKLSEAISALVEYVQLGKFDSAMFVGLDDKIQEARESFQESQ